MPLEVPIFLLSRLIISFEMLSCSVGEMKTFTGRNIFVNKIYTWLLLKFLNSNLTKSWREIIFVSATKIGKNTTNILNYYVSNEIHTLANQVKYLNVGN